MVSDKSDSDGSVGGRAKKGQDWHYHKKSFIRFRAVVNPRILISGFVVMSCQYVALILSGMGPFSVWVFTLRALGTADGNRNELK